MSQDRRVWGAGTPRTVRAHWALRELDLPYECEPIVPRTPAMERSDFLAVSRRGKVPILDDAGLVVGESGAIVLYLADRYDDGDARRLSVPFDDPSRGPYYDLCSFVVTELDATALYVIRRHEGLPEIYGAAPAAITAARQYFTRQLAEMERRLSDGRPHLLGDAFTSPDLLLVTCLDWAKFLPDPIPIPDRLVEYRERIAVRPAYHAAMASNYAPLARLAGSGAGSTS